MALVEIPYHQIKAQPWKLLQRGRSLAQADLYTLEWNGQSVVLKDVTARPLWMRWLWGRWTLGREARGMIAAEGLTGVPRVLARVGRDAILLEMIPGSTLAKPVSPPPLEYFNRLTALVAALHQRGVAHGDLRRTNLMIDERGQPYLVDFASAIVTRPGVLGFIWRVAYRCCVQIDQSKLARLKAACYPNALTAAEVVAIENPPWFLWVGQFLRRRIYPHWRKLWQGGRGQLSADDSIRLRR
jgi:predicted Ser/Thr protein kinase